MRTNHCLDGRTEEGESRRVEFIMQQAHDAFAVVKDHRPVAKQQVVPFCADNESGILNLVEYEVFETLAHEGCSVDFVFNGHDNLGAHAPIVHFMAVPPRFSRSGVSAIRFPTLSPALSTCRPPALGSSHPSRFRLARGG